MNFLMEDLGSLVGGRGLDLNTTTITRKTPFCYKLFGDIMCFLYNWLISKWYSIFYY